MKNQGVAREFTSGDLKNKQRTNAESPLLELYLFYTMPSEERKLLAASEFVIPTRDTFSLETIVAEVEQHLDEENKTKTTTAPMAVAYTVFVTQPVLVVLLVFLDLYPKQRGSNGLWESVLREYYALKGADASKRETFFATWTTRLVKRVRENINQLGGAGDQEDEEGEATQLLRELIDDSDGQAETRMRSLLEQLLRKPVVRGELAHALQEKKRRRAILTTGVYKMNTVQQVGAQTMGTFYAYLRHRSETEDDQLCRRVVAQVEWLARQKLTEASLVAPVLRRLPFCVDFTVENELLFKWLCVLQNSTCQFIATRLNNDTRSIDAAYAQLPCLPYSHWALKITGRGDVPLQQQETTDRLYVDHYCDDVLRPLLFEAFWTNVLLFVTANGGSSSSSSGTVDREAKQQLSCLDAEQLFSLVERYNDTRLSRGHYTPDFHSLLNRLFTRLFVINQFIQSSSRGAEEEEEADMAVEGGGGGGVTHHSRWRLRVTEEDEAHLVDQTLSQFFAHGQLLVRLVPINLALYNVTPDQLQVLMRHQLQSRVPYEPLTASVPCSRLHETTDRNLAACVAFCRRRAMENAADDPVNASRNGTVVSVFDTEYTLSLGDLFESYVDLAAVNDTPASLAHAQQSRMNDLFNLFEYDAIDDRDYNDTFESRVSQYERVHAVFDRQHAAYYTSRRLAHRGAASMRDWLAKIGVDTIGAVRSLLDTVYDSTQEMGYAGADHSHQYHHRRHSYVIVVRSLTPDGREIYTDASGPEAGVAFDARRLDDPESQITIIVSLHRHVYRPLESRDSVLDAWDDSEAAANAHTLNLIVEERVRVPTPRNRVLRVERFTATTVQWPVDDGTLLLQGRVATNRLLSRQQVMHWLGLTEKVNDKHTRIVPFYDERTRVVPFYDAHTHQMRVVVTIDRDASNADIDALAYSDDALAYHFVSGALEEYHTMYDTGRAHEMREAQSLVVQRLNEPRYMALYIKTRFALYRQTGLAAMLAENGQPMMADLAAPVLYVTDAGDAVTAEQQEYHLESVRPCLLGNELVLSNARQEGGEPRVRIMAERLIRNTERFLARDPTSNIPALYNYMTNQT